MQKHQGLRFDDCSETGKKTHILTLDELRKIIPTINRGSIHSKGIPQNLDFMIINTDESSSKLLTVPKEAEEEIRKSLDFLQNDIPKPVSKIIKNTKL